MADTPAEAPKRRRTPKAPAEPKTPRTRKAAAKAPKAAPTPAPASAPAVDTSPTPAKAVRKPRAKAAAASSDATPAKRGRKPRAQAATAPAAASAEQASPAKTARKPRTRTAAADKPKRQPRKPAAPSPAPAPAPAAAVAAVAAPVRKAVERAREVLPEAPPKAGLFGALGTLAAVGGAFFLWRASKAEEPDYQVLESDGAIEIRRYPALVTAGTEQRGQRTDALNQGFRVLADYIFAKSRPGAKLPMTAPVLSDSDGGGSWRTRFIMPTGKARAELPSAPSGVDLVSESSKRVAAIRFSGRADDADLDMKENALRSWLQMRSYPHEGRAVHAFYNAPFLPGPLRRNEVMIVLSEEGGAG